jgi:hypothetical protein
MYFLRLVLQFTPQMIAETVVLRIERRLIFLLLIDRHLASLSRDSSHRVSYSAPINMAAKHSFRIKTFVCSTDILIGLLHIVVSRVWRKVRNSTKICSVVLELLQTDRQTNVAKLSPSPPSFFCSKSPQNYNKRESLEVVTAKLLRSGLILKTTAPRSFETSLTSNRTTENQITEELVICCRCVTYAGFSCLS